MTNLQPLALYFHWPFCLAKCPYCDFNVHVRAQIDHDAFEEAYLRSVAHYAALLPDRQVTSIFFGGGTPSLMRPQTVARILNAVQSAWNMARDAEVTLEANPTSVEAEKFKAFSQSGINRVSLGIQALNDKDLKFLGRTHDRKTALNALDIARRIFARVNFDLIYARPNQTLKDWEAELVEAGDRAAGHLSCYQLTVERNTPFYFDRAQGKFQMPDDDRAADFYLLTQEILAGRGLPAYEVSNHAEAGAESLHNMAYWRYGDYAGIGPGAHGRLMMGGQKYALRDHSAPDIWLARVAAQGSGAHAPEAIAPRDRFVEALMMGLRLREGIDLNGLALRSGVDLEDMIDMNHLRDLAAQAWLIVQGSHVKAGIEGWLRLNAIVPYLIKEENGH